MTVEEYVDTVCEKQSETNAGDAATYAESEKVLAELLVVMEGVTPPEEISDYHDVNLALLRWSLDFAQEQDANAKPDFTELWMSARASSEFRDLVEPSREAWDALDSENKRLLKDGDCSGAYSY